MIIVVKKDKKNKKLFIIENGNITAITKVAKVSNAIIFKNKHSWIINNINIDIAKNLGLIGIKKY